MIWLKRFILSIQFLTRIPLPIQLDVNSEDFAKSMIFFPLVGLVVGTFMVMGVSGAAALKFVWMPSVIAVLVQVLITGALHVDGLGDTFDGFFSNKPRGRILEIMRDSRIGTNAGTAIFFDLSIKIAAFWEIQRLFGFLFTAVVAAAPIIGRMGVVGAAALSRYAREENGLGKHFLNGVGLLEYTGSLLIGCLLLFFVLGKGFFLHVFINFAAIFLFTKFCERKIGGHTGDTLGAVNEIGEIVFLLTFPILKGFI